MKSMKTRIALIVAIVLLSALTITALAAPKAAVAEPEPGAREAVILDAGFHCNANGGNGRVWVSAYDAKYEADKNLKKNGIGGVLEDLIYLGDNCWLLANQTDYVCPQCGSTVWVSYSNKSGVPDGKNIQLTHPPESDEVLKGAAEATVNISTQFDEVFYKAVYEKVTDENTSATLVSYKNHTIMNSDSGNNSTNQFSYRVNLDETEGERVAIAISNQNSNTPTGIGQYYTYKIIGDTLIVSVFLPAVKISVISRLTGNVYPGGV